MTGGGVLSSIITIGGVLLLWFEVGYDFLFQIPFILLLLSVSFQGKRCYFYCCSWAVLYGFGFFTFFAVFF